ncbi:MAG TPA: T9SS type A sorting domain-containing protein [Puia sp.]
MKQLYKLFRAAALCLAVILLVPNFLHAQKRTLTAHASTKIDGVIGGFYTSLPASYNSTTKSYPLLIFIHGIGEIGDGSAAALPAVLRNGPPMQINNQVNYGTNANFPDPVTVNGKSFEFIVVAPQFNQWTGLGGTVQAINDMINYCKTNYRVDASKVYLTGLSMGGGITWDFSGSTSNNQLAGIVVVAGAQNPSATAVSQIVKEHLPVWATHNLNDPTVPESATVAWVNQINAAGANPQALETIFNTSGHGGWIPTYGAPGTPGITNSKGQNVYQWMLQYKRSGDNILIDNSTSTTQAPPTVSAGSNQTLTLAGSTSTAAAATTTSTTLSGSASTTGSIAGYQWTQVSGPSAATFGNAKAASTSVSGLAQGTYTFKLTATDNTGQSASAQVTVTVNPAPVTVVFTVNAGPDVSITLPTNSVKLTGSTTVQGTTLSSCKWTQVSGPNTATISNGGTITPTIGGVIAGSYVFQVTITSAAGTSTSDQVKLTVNPAPVANVFTVNAGPDVSITLPTNSVKLTGVATVQGSIGLAACNWTQVSGPNTATISNGGTITPTIGGVIAGSYTFKVTLTSTSGTSTSDQMTLTVNPAPATTVFTVNAGPDVAITLPTNSVKLTGSATVEYTTLSSCKWTQVSGPNTATISNSGTITPTISGVIAGSYVFKVTIVSSSGASTSDQMTLTVNPAPVTSVFTVSAGPDKSVTLPVSSVQITGSTTVQGETVASCKWKQVSGPNAATIVNSGTIAPSVSNLVAGTYVFEVDMTSTSGKTVSDQMTLTVSAAAITTVFTANAGPDVFITLPTSSWKIIGTCIVKGVTVATCKWKQVSGPGTATISGGGSISPVVSNLIAGTYIFEVDITSTTGLATSDQMMIKVNPSSTSYTGSGSATNGPGIVDSSASTADLKLYPNPVLVGQQVVVEGQGLKTGTVKITIYDLSGRQAKQQVVENTSENYFRQTISVDGLARGMYVLTLSSGNEKPRLFKFVVQ